MVDDLDRRCHERRARHLDAPRAGGLGRAPAAEVVAGTGRSPSASARDRLAGRPRSSSTAIRSGCARRSRISSATPSSTAPTGGPSRSVDQSGRRGGLRRARRGPGLSPEDIGRLFGRFQRLSAKPTGGESSTGLGLSIVKRIAELHERPGRGGEPRPGPRRRFLAPPSCARARRNERAQHISSSTTKSRPARWLATT